MNNLEVAVGLIQDGEVSKGLAMMEEILSQADEETAYQIAQIYFEMGRLGDAEEVVTNLLTKDPNNSHLILFSAELAIDMENEEYAIDVLNNIDESDENFLSAQLLLADIYQGQGIEEAAENRLKNAHQMDPENPILSFALAEFYRISGRARQAVPYYKESLHAEELAHEEVNTKLAETLSLSGSFEEALIYYKKGLEEHKTLDGLFGYGMTAYQAEKYQTAITTLEELRAMDYQYSTLYPVLAAAYQEEGAKDEALEILEAGLEVDEYNERLFTQAADIAEQSGLTDKAIHYHRQLLALNPGHENAAERLSELLYDNGDYEGIIDILNETTSTPRVQWFAGKALLEEDRIEEALKQYESAQTTFKDNPQFLREYGELLWQTGKRSDALQLLRHALSFNPDDHELLLFVERIEQDF